MKKQSQYSDTIVHVPGDLVSIMRRFANRTHYEAAVKAEYLNRPPYQPLPDDPRLGNSYSFHNESDDTELLFIHQLKGHKPTGSTSSGLDIVYEFVGDMTFNDFRRYYNRHVGLFNRTEPPGHSLRGEKDKTETYRAVYKNDSLTDDYAGFITNPPYPALSLGHTRSHLKWLLPALLGLAVGLVTVPLLQTLREQPKD